MSGNAIHPHPTSIGVSKVTENRFAIAGGKPGMEVSWQVTGVRHDAYARKHPIAVEVEKPANERGYYLHPDAFGLPADRGVDERKLSRSNPSVKFGNQSRAGAPASQANKRAGAAKPTPNTNAPTVLGRNETKAVGRPK